MKLEEEVKNGEKDLTLEMWFESHTGLFCTPIRMTHSTPNSINTPFIQFLRVKQCTKLCLLP